MKRIRYILLALLGLVVLIAVFGAVFGPGTWYAELKSWDTVLAAAMTLAGLAIAGVYGGEQVRSQIEANAEAARKQHDREQITEALRVGATLAGEISSIIEAIGLKIEMIDMVFTDDESRQNAVLFSTVLASTHDAIHRIRYYESAGDRIGLLGAPVVEKIEAFNSWLEDFRAQYLEHHVEKAKELTSAQVGEHIDAFRRAATIVEKRGQQTYDALKTRITELEAERDAL